MKTAAAAFLALLVLLSAMILSQEQLLFPTGAVPSAGPLPANAQRVLIETGSGETLHGVHLPRAGGGQGPAALILGFGGNAWNAQHVAEYLHDIFPQADVIAFHYRGYRPSTGTPSAAALIEDAPLVLGTAIERARPDRTVAVGFSIGSGVAASLAKQPGVDGLILVTPFDSLKAVAGDLYPWLPVGPFFRHEIDAAARLRDAAVPVAIVAAERDEIIPPARTAALRPHVRKLVFDRTIAGAGHNDIYHNSAFRRDLRLAFEAVVSGESANRP